jgi:phosphatidylglycerol:prolipoprotein diacylglycerol transferase
LNPIAFKLGPFAVHWYGIFIALAFLLGIMLAGYQAQKRGIHPDLFANLVLLVIPGSIIGARLYYIIFNWGYYAAHPQEILAIWHGGLAIHGGYYRWLFSRLLVYQADKELRLWP